MIFVRSIVGHRVMSVPMTVRPIQPSRLSRAWAASRREYQGSAMSRARMTPKVTPTGRIAAAAK
jgi:hypothetical protein